ncbi:hypothetical protein [Streptomyces sp. SAJ15]|uniref:hypothetical protein n=1 Tax=Streptomyces sp. SAJ15 TaxID=2011095 RepID=UPI00118661E8|nr:hypothetical protein [Streptomyces sp. SAJ15]
MDSGAAAILGAVIGAVGAGSAAVVTGLWGSRITRRQLAAQEAQLRRQLRAEHARARREPRSKVYADFLVQARAVERALGRYQESHTRTLESLHEAIAMLDHLGVQILLEGPPSVAPASEAVIKHAHRCIRPLRGAIEALERFGEGSLEHIQQRDAVADTGLQFTATVKHFAEAARRVLDDDGVEASPPH